VISKNFAVSFRLGELSYLCSAATHAYALCFSISYQSKEVMRVYVRQFIDNGAGSIGLKRRFSFDTHNRMSQRSLRSLIAI
jgi:hypothetical protein